VCCRVLQYFAVCCSVGLRDYKGGELVVEGVLQCVAGCCSVLQCLAVSYSVLQCGTRRLQGRRVGR